MVSGAAGRYALAFFELAKDAKALDAVEADCNLLDALVAGNAMVKALTASPLVRRDERGRAVAALVADMGAIAPGASLHPLTGKFLGVAAANGRLGELPAMIAAFRSLLARERGEISAEVTSAHKLTAAQVKALAAKLKAMVGRDVNLNAQVDESLLGGLVVKIGSRMIDSSLKTKLNNLQVAMKEVG